MVWKIGIFSAFYTQWLRDKIKQKWIILKKIRQNIKRNIHIDSWEKQFDRLLRLIVGPKFRENNSTESS